MATFLDRTASDTFATTDQSKQDIEAIHALLSTYVETWNRHEIDAWGELFTDDVDYVNRGSGWWQSNEQNVDGHKAIHDELEQRSQVMDYSATVAKVSFLAPEIALAQVTWNWPGMEASSEGPETFAGMITMVLLKRSGTWLIRAVQNTVTS